MAEISILEPRVLPRVVQEFDGLETMLGRQIVRIERDDQPTWEYDILRSARGAQLIHNAPNAEAQILDHLPIGHMQGTYAYIRDKKTFNATTLRWLRRAGEGRVAARNAEQRVIEELQDIRLQHMRAEETAIWAMIQGSWTYVTVNGVSITVDYGLPALHSVTTTVTTWATATNDITVDIALWKRVMSRDAGLPITVAYLNSVTMRYLVANDFSQEHLSDRQKDRYTTEGILPRFFGINWVEYDDGYVDSGGSFVPYIGDDTIVFLATGGAPYLSLQYGPSADLDAPPMWTGPFTKSWVEPDPSGRQILVEQNYIPININPNKVIVADTVA